MKQILVVDDDRELRSTLVEICEQNGFSVSAAQHADEAFALLEGRAFDLILLDMVMPGMDGMTALSLLKQKCPHTRIIIMTAYATVQNAVQALQQGADDYITKPFKMNDLLVSVQRCLEEARFSDCESLIDMDDTFKCLSNPIRRQILTLLAEHKELRFMEIPRLLHIDDHTKANFHLKILKEAALLKQTEKKNYCLTEKGRKVISCMKEIATAPPS